MVSPLHILIDEGDRQDEVEVECADDVGNHTDAYSEGSIFEVCDLDVHGAELDTPADVSILRWWIFKS